MTEFSLWKFKDNKTIYESQWESAVAPDWYIYFTMCLCVNCKVITAERVIRTPNTRQEKLTHTGRRGGFLACNCTVHLSLPVQDVVILK